MPLFKYITHSQIHPCIFISKRISCIPEARSASNISSFAREKKGESSLLWKECVLFYADLHLPCKECSMHRMQNTICSSYKHKKGMYCTYFRKCIHIIFLPFNSKRISLYVKHYCIACAHFTTQIITIAWGFLVG